MENNLTRKSSTINSKFKDRNSRIYFLVQDTKDVLLKASVKFIYEIAYTLKKNNFNTIILHEKNDYTGVAKWLG
jgi:hypothetical protein